MLPRPRRSDWRTRHSYGVKLSSNLHVHKIGIGNTQDWHTKQKIISCCVENCGYFENEKPFWDEYGISPIHVHTSGHADVKQLKKFASALNPVAIIPIHTLSPERFTEYFGSKVRMLSDGKPTEL